MTDGDKGIPGKVSLKHLKPTAVRGGWVMATDQEEEDSSSERENKGGGLTGRRRQPKFGVWGAVRRPMGAKLSAQGTHRGGVVLRQKVAPHGCTPKAHHLLPPTGK